MTAITLLGDKKSSHPPKSLCPQITVNRDTDHSRRLFLSIFVKCESVSSVNIFYLQWTLLFTSPNCISFYIIIGCRSNLGCPLPFLKPLWNWSYSFKLFQHKKVFILCFPKMTSNIQPQNIFYHLVFPLRIWHFYLILSNVNFICN